MYTFAVPVLVMPVNQAFGGNVMISSVPASSGIAAWVEDTTTALAVALAELVPTPMNTSVEPALTTRYWLPPSVVDKACTGVGAEVAAMKVTVLPDGQKGADTLML